MNPGRELDALIAEKVMDWETPATWPDVWNTYSKQGTIAKSQFCPSTDIAAAWEVWIKVGRDFCISLTKRMGCNGWVWDANINGEAFATSASSSHAICLAALKAVGG